MRTICFFYAVYCMQMHAALDRLKNAVRMSPYGLREKYQTSHN